MTPRCDQGWYHPDFWWWNYVSRLQADFKHHQWWSNVSINLSFGDVVGRKHFWIAKSSIANKSLFLILLAFASGQTRPPWILHSLVCDVMKGCFAWLHNWHQRRTCIFRECFVGPEVQTQSKISAATSKNVWLEKGGMFIDWYWRLISKQFFLVRDDTVPLFSNIFSSQIPFAGGSRYGGGGYHQDVKASTWCISYHFMIFIGRFGCWDLVLGSLGSMQTKHLGVEIGKSFPCVQALADRRTLMIRLPNREFHGCGHWERIKLLVAGSSWIRVELIQHFLNRAVLFLTSGLRFRVLSLNP